MFEQSVGTLEIWKKKTFKLFLDYSEDNSLESLDGNVIIQTKSFANLNKGSEFDIEQIKQIFRIRLKLVFQWYNKILLITSIYRNQNNK